MSAWLFEFDDGPMYDAATDTFTTTYDSDASESFAGTDIDGMHLYPIGNGSWTWSIFDESSAIVNVFAIEKHRYGQDMYIPEFHGSGTMLQLYSSEANPYGTKEVITWMSEFGTDFHLLEFTVRDEDCRLSRLDIVLLDGFTRSGNVKRPGRETMYSNA